MAPRTAPVASALLLLLLPQSLEVEAGNKLLDMNCSVGLSWWDRLLEKELLCGAVRHGTVPTSWSALGTGEVVLKSREGAAVAAAAAHLQTWLAHLYKHCLSYML